MHQLVGRIMVAMAVGLVSLVALAPPATANEQTVLVDFYFDLDGDGIKDPGESSRPPSSLHPNQTGWSARVDYYKVTDNNLILATNWTWLGLAGSSTTSQRLSPGRWVAVLNVVSPGNMNTAPESWAGPLTQTQPQGHQSLEFTVTEGGATQSLRFGYGPRDENFSAPPAGPAFSVRSDENYNQVADAGEPAVANGVEFSLTAVHLANDSRRTGVTSGGQVAFAPGSPLGAHVLSVSYADAAPTPTNWNTMGYAEGSPGVISYLVHNAAGKCDPDLDDGETGTCAIWGPIDSLPTVAVLPARTRIAGQVFVDTDGDGVRDPGEVAPDVNDLVVEFVPRDTYYDGEGENPFRWIGEPAPVAANGTYDLGRVPKGHYEITTNQSSWTVTTGRVEVPTTGADIGPVDVGLAGTHVSGQLYVDSDADLEADSSEERLSGVTLQTRSWVGEALEIIDEVTTDAQGRFRIRVNPDSPEIMVADGLPAHVQQDDHFSLDLDSTGEVTHDLRVQPAGVPERIWDSWSRTDGEVRKLWWEEPDPGESDITGYVIRTWQLNQWEMPTAKLSERCIAGGTFTTAPTSGDLATVQAVNALGVGPLNPWNEDAAPDREDGTPAVEVACSTLFDGDEPGEPPVTPDAAPPQPQRPQVTLRPRAAVVTWQPGASTDEHGAATEYVVRRKQGKGPWTTAATVPASTQRVTVKGLAPRKKYTFTVVARNAVGESSASPGRTVTAQAAPAAPRAVKARAQRRAVLLRWKPGALKAQHGTTVRYLVQRKVGKKWRTVTTRPAKARKHRLTGLAPRKVVVLRVVARSAVGDTPSKVVRARPRR